MPKICHEHSVAAGIACNSPELVARRRQAGYTMLATPCDVILLRQAVDALLSSARG